MFGLLMLLFIVLNASTNRENVNIASRQRANICSKSLHSTDVSFGFTLRRVLSIPKPYQCRGDIIQQESLGTDML